MAEKQSSEDILNETKDYSGQRSTDADNADILRAIQRIERRLDRLEVDSRGPHPLAASGLRSFPQHPSVSDDYQSPYQANRFSPSPDRKFSSGKPELHEVQERFNVIKLSVDKVVLPPYMKLHDTRSGIKRDDQPLVNILSKSGRYVETVLKLLSQTQDGAQLDCDPIIEVLIAHIQYLQEEFAALLVKGRFDDNTAQLFKALQKGTSGFNDSCLQNVRVAAELSSIATRYPPSQPTRGHYNNFSSFRRPFRQGTTSFRGRGFRDFGFRDSNNNIQ